MVKTDFNLINPSPNLKLDSSNFMRIRILIPTSEEWVAFSKKGKYYVVNSNSPQRFYTFDIGDFEEEGIQGIAFIRGLPKYTNILDENERIEWNLFKSQAILIEYAKLGLTEESPKELQIQKAMQFYQKDIISILNSEYHIKLESIAIKPKYSGKDFQLFTIPELPSLLYDREIWRFHREPLKIQLYDKTLDIDCPANYKLVIVKGNPKKKGIWKNDVALCRKKTAKDIPEPMETPKPSFPLPPKFPLTESELKYKNELVAMAKTQKIDSILKILTCEEIAELLRFIKQSQKYLSEAQSPNYETELESLYELNFFIKHYLQKNRKKCPSLKSKL